MNAFHAYIAGFFDGEGSVTITRQKSGDHQDYHKIILTISQVAQHRAILDTIAAEFGGHVHLRKERTRVGQKWAERATWQLQERAKIEAFLETIGPMLIVKATPAWIAREFLASVSKGRLIRDDIGRLNGRVLAEEEVAMRDGFMLAIQEANRTGNRDGLTRTSVRREAFV